MCWLADRPALAEPAWYAETAWLASELPANLATTSIGGLSFNLNSFLGADRYYSAGISGQNTITFNLEAGHFWNGHETLQHVASNSTHFISDTNAYGRGAIATLYDRHATWTAMLIGGRQTAVNPSILQQGIAYSTNLRSAAIATDWAGSAYALGFDISGDTYSTAYDAASGTA